ncbi:MAG: serine/threonine-protein kinase, partial [Myxococcota bacterium]
MLRRLDKYELLEEIGHGGMATVYRARDTRLERDVAIKVLHPHLQKTPEARQRFTREAKSVAKLRHDRIMEIHDYSGEGDGESYIAAELLTGPTLKKFIEDGGGLPAEVAAAFTVQIAEALDAAHQAKIVHRDVKPENVLLHEGRGVKLTDFGIAQMVDSQSMTATGQILGSPGHMAPEQVAGEVDERSDLFSLGTVLYYLATGKLPFTGRNPHQVIKRIVDGEYPPPLRLAPAMGSDLAAIIDRCLRVDPAERLQTADEVVGALRRFLLGLDIEDSDALVREYLNDTEATTARLRENAIAVLLTRARQHVSARDRAAALPVLNRILALQDGHVEALALVEKLANVDGRRRIAVAALAALGVLGVATAFAWPDAGSGDAVRSADAGVPDAAVALDASPNASPDASPSVDAAVEAAEEPAPEPADASREGRRPRRDVPRGPREVRFVFTPRNVSISVDGAAFRAFGPGFRSIELPPGRHRFRVQGAAGCCEDLDFVETIPAGREPFNLARTLQYKRASLLSETRLVRVF